MKTFKSPEKRQEALALAQDMCGVEKIRAYQFAGRSDLARAYANTLLIGDGISYGTGHYAGSPYAPDDWRVLKLKRRFDAIGAPYNVEAAKKGLLYSHIEVSEDRPSQKDIRTIDELLETHGIPGSERTNIFMRMRDTRREKIHPLSHEVSRFCLGRIKDTGYSNVAARTGIPRNETVAFYLDKFFAGDTEGIRIEHLYYYAEDLGGKLNSLIQREHLNGAEIASRVLRLLEGSGNPRMNLRVIDELCKIPSVGLPKEVVLRALEEFVACEGELREGHGEDFVAILGLEYLGADPQFRALREASLKNEIESVACLPKRIEYAVNTFGIDPSKGWLNKALRRHVSNWMGSRDPFYLGSAILFGKKYGLLGRDQIRGLKRKLRVLKEIKGVLNE